MRKVAIALSTVSTLLYMYGELIGSRILLSIEPNGTNRPLVSSESTPSSAVEEPCLTEVLDGEWVPMAKDQFADFKCCQQQDFYYKKHSECQSSFDLSGNFDGHPKLLPHICGGAVCQCSFTETHVWKSFDEKVLRPWDGHEFCSVLGNRTVLMVGDSTMSQTASVFMSDLHSVGCQTQMHFRLGDTLIFENMGAMNRGRHWMDAVKELHPDIVILTAGAHIHSLANFTKVIDSVIEDIVGDARRNYPDMTVVWKTQNPAGKRVSLLHLHPFEAAQNKEGLHQFDYHGQFWDRDNLAIAKMQAAGIPFLDMRMLYSRTLAHPLERGDSLHSCVPGPLSVFPQLFQKLFVDDDLAVPRCINKQGSLDS